MNSDEQLTFALAQAEFWRLRYLSAKNVTDKELDFVVRRVTAALREERDWLFARLVEYMQSEHHHLTKEMLPLEMFEECLKVQFAARDAIHALGEKP
jgi:hypothetical protein